MRGSGYHNSYDPNNMGDFICTTKNSFALLGTEYDIDYNNYYHKCYKNESNGNDENELFETGGEFAASAHDTCYFSDDLYDFLPDSKNICVRSHFGSSHFGSSYFLLKTDLVGGPKRPSA